MNLRYWLGLSIGLLLLSGCLSQSPSEDDALCACVQTDAQGQWDMHLSPECMALCMDKFGPELSGMEAWFRAHCDYSFEHPELKESAPIERAAFRP
jgi:hypothetical protein